MKLSNKTAAPRRRSPGGPDRPVNIPFRAVINGTALLERGRAEPWMVEHAIREYMSKSSGIQIGDLEVELV